LSYRDHPLRVRRGLGDFQRLEIGEVYLIARPDSIQNIGPVGYKYLTGNRKIYAAV
jgi:hypothetical protein